MSKNLARFALACGALLLALPLGQAQTVPPAPALLEGRVTDAATGEPVAGIDISASGPVKLGILQTDDAGRYQFKATQPGLYEVRVHAEGYGGFPGAGRRFVRLAPGETLRDIDFRLRRAATVSGHVFRSDKSPVAGAEVTLLIREGSWDGKPRWRALYFSKHTGADGAYEIPDVAEGRYLLKVHRPSPVVINPAKEEPAVPGPAALQFYPSGRNVLEAAPLDIEAGSRLERMDFVLPDVTPVCMEAALPPVPANAGAASIGLVLFDRESGTNALVASKGDLAGQRARVCGLPPGRYQAVALLSKTDEPNKPVLSFGWKEFDARRETVDLGALVLEESGPLPGRIRVEGAKPEDPIPPGLGLELRIHRNRMIGEILGARIEPDGNFLFRRLLSDRYEIQVLRLPARHWVARLDQDGWDAATGLVRPGGFLNITLRTDGPLVQGVVLDEKQNPLPDVLVILAPAGAGPVRALRSDQRGRFEWSAGLAPGAYRVIAVEGYPLTLQADEILLRERAAAGKEIKLEPGATESLTLRPVSWR